MTTRLPPSPAPHAEHARTRIMTGIFLAVLLAALDQTIVTAAGPIIQDDLDIPPALYTWLTIGYLITSTVSLPIAGKLSDLFGRRAVVLTGLGLFLLGSLLCGFAWNAWTLILFRALQGLGSGALLAGATATIADLYPPAQRGRINGVFGAVFGVASVLGPFAGGALTDLLSWPWVFWINLPLGALASWFIARSTLQHRHATHDTRVDFAGAAWLTLAVVSLLHALSLGKPTPGPGEFAWTSTPILALLSLGVASGVAFIRTERHAENPILDLRLFHDRTFVLVTLAVFVLGASFLTAGVFLPLFMVNILGVSATQAGLSTTPLTFGLIVSSLVCGTLATRLRRYKPIMLAGLAVLTVGFLLLGFTLTPTTTTVQVSLMMLLVGLGLGPVVSLYTLAVQNALPPERTGVATASVTFFQQLGSTVGLAVMGTVFAVSLAATTPSTPGASDTASRSVSASPPRAGDAAPSAPRSGPAKGSTVTRAFSTDPEARTTYTNALRRQFLLATLLVLLGAGVTAALPDLPLGSRADDHDGPPVH